MIHGANVDSSDFCASLVGARQVVVASLLSPQEQSVHAVHELHWLSASMLVSKVVGETESAAAHEAQHSPANPKAAKVIRTSPTAPIEMGGPVSVFADARNESDDRNQKANQSHPFVKRLVG